MFFEGNRWRGFLFYFLFFHELFFFISTLFCGLFSSFL